MMRFGSWTLSTLAPSWRLGWPSLWRDRWRWLARRWAFALAGFAVGMLGVVGWHFDAFEALWESEAQVLDLQSKIQIQEQSVQIKQAPGATASLNTPAGPPPVMAWWPVQGAQAAVWPQLERLLVQHGLRLLSLRPEPPSSGGAWPSQAVALRLQGRFGDWVNVWASLNARGPVWGIERLRITPQEGGVAIDAVLRLWLSPEPTAMAKLAGTPVLAELMPSSALIPLRSGAGASVFVATASTPGTPSGMAAGVKTEEMVRASSRTGLASSALVPEKRTLAETIPSLSPDPAKWPLEQVRLAGVWRQAQGEELILMAGPHWVRARVGQRIGANGHVVNSIHAEEVHLRAAQGPVWVIGLEKAKP